MASTQPALEEAQQYINDNLVALCLEAEAWSQQGFLTVHQQKLRHVASLLAPLVGPYAALRVAREEVMAYAMRSVAHGMHNYAMPQDNDTFDRWLERIGFAAIKEHTAESTKTFVRSAFLAGRRFGDAIARVDGLPDSLRAVLEERQNQQMLHDYTAEHDDTHVNEELAAFACVYIMPQGVREWDASSTGYGDTFVEALLPADWTVNIPEDRQRQLVKGIAVALAELERLQRMKEKENERKSA